MRHIKKNVIKTQLPYNHDHDGSLTIKVNEWIKLECQK